MTKRRAVALGVFTAWPFLYMILFMSSILMAILADLASTGPAGEPPDVFLFIIPLHLLTMLEIFALMIFYVIYLFKTDAVPQDKKALWAAVILLGGMVSMPVFWYLYVWRQTSRSSPEPLAEGAAGDRAP